MNILYILNNFSDLFSFYFCVRCKSMSQFIDAIILSNKKSNSNLFWLWIQIDNSYKQRSLGLLRDREWHREKGIKCIAMPTTFGTCKRRPVECLKKIIHKAVVASQMVSKDLGSNSFIRSPIIVLKILRINSAYNSK